MAPPTVIAMSDLSAPVESPPPRNVEPWTRVAGHRVIANNGRSAFCRCGERQGDARPADEWRVEHLANAWPILVERLPGESLEDWRSRLRVALGEARVAAEPEAARLMAAMQVGPGHDYPVLDDFDLTAEEQAEVLEHQLAGRPFDRMT